MHRGARSRGEKREEPRALQSASRGEGKSPYNSVVFAGFLVALSIGSQGASGLFRQGQKISIVAVGTSKAVWDPSGKRLSKWPGESVLGQFSPMPLKDKRLLVMLKTPIPDEPSMAYQVGAGVTLPFGLVLLSGPSAVPSKRWATWYLVGPFSSGRGSDSVQVGLADGKWTAIGVGTFKNGRVLKRTGKEFLLDAHQSPKGQAKTITLDVVMPTDHSRYAYRMQAIDNAGKAFQRAGSTNLRGWTKTESYFQGDLKAVGRVELQRRPYVWKIFPNVRLAPK